MYEECKVIVVNNTPEMIDLLKSFGYEQRSGSAGYTRETICIVPKKKWFWQSSDPIGTYTKQL